MSYQLGHNVRYEHNLKTEIYKRGYTLSSFADMVGINRITLNRLFKAEHKVRGDTIYLISKGLEMTYEKVEKLCQMN